MASAEAPAPTGEEQPKRKSRRYWFPIAWPILLVLFCVIVQLSTDDQGLANSAIHLSVILAAVGWSVWILMRSGPGLSSRIAFAAVLLLPVLAHYLQFSPIETINNGDVGLVGWKWRWSDPDRDLEAKTVKSDRATQLQTTPLDYPGFLGTRYWAEVSEAALDPDWETQPPTELWRQRIGAGWSSFAVVGNLAFTQEQRGEQEMVSCYDLESGDLVWSHADDARFDPSGGGSLGGVGPQATPTVNDGRVFSHGATGIINCLDAATGELLWSHDVEKEFGVETLLWGKSSSPVVYGDWILVSIGDAAANVEEAYSQAGNSLVAFSQESGEIVWKAGDRRSSYATPVVTTLAGVEQIVVVNEDFVTSHRASDGTILWEHPWEGRSDSNASASQPIPVGDDRVFLSKGYGIGSELIQVSNEGDQWKSETLWKKPIMKTKMGNVVLRDGYVYGLDGVNLGCVELATGKKRWVKRRRPGFGHGQVLLAGEHILVLTENGEVVLVDVNSDEYTERGSFPALEGVTWNNPTLVGSRLLVRNAEWAACYELPLLSEPPPIAPGAE